MGVLIDNLVLFLQAIGGFITPWALFHMAWSTLLGIVIGALPGLTATMGVALITTLTYKLQPDLAILVLMCVYVGAIYGGSRTAILLNIPGTPANAATTLDGFPLAKQGLAGRAMGVATSGSVLGSIIGMFFLATLAPLLGNYALKFQSYEFFWLAIFGIVISGHLTSLDDPIKGWIAGFLGLMTAMVGQEGIHAYERFTYGTTELMGGFALIPAMVGAFGLAEVLSVMRNPPAEMAQNPQDSVIPKLGGYHEILADHRPERADRDGDRHHPGGRRGHRGVGFLRRGPAEEQGGGKVREGLHRRADGRGDGEQRRRARRHHSRAHPGHPRLGPGGGAARRHVHPRDPAGPHDHGGVALVRLPGGGHGLFCHHRHPHLTESRSPSRS